MKKLFVLLLIILPFNLAVADKQTTFDNDIFNKAQSDGKTVIVSSWIKYCTSCASQMKALKDVEKDFDNLIYLTFDVTNREIAKQLNIQFQTTLVIYKNNKEVYRSLGELTKDKIYKAINSVI
jgi:thioredoxin 1|tara:strand:- start:360 stop:728 length:369 start_codon:yes stop_codon:yes gene_type:complete